MCDPVTGGMMVLSMIQQQQQQQAQGDAVRQQNAMAAQNADMQIAGMKRDVGALHDEQINIAEAGFESAEDAADAKLKLSIEAKRTESTLIASNLENLGGGGQTSDSILANHKRGVLGSLNDIEDNFLRGEKKRKHAWDNLDRDKHNRWYTAKSNIMALPRSGQQSGASRLFGITTAAVSGYGTGKSLTRVQPADPTRTA
jgi:hypothetical protein